MPGITPTSTIDNRENLTTMLKISSYTSLLHTWEHFHDFI
jgi:hypothetical protein